MINQSRDDVYRGVADAMEIALGRRLSSLSDDLNFDSDVEGWNSFLFVELLIETQERFAVEIGADRIERIATFGDLVRAVELALANTSR